MNKDEALKLALDALCHIVPANENEYEIRRMQRIAIAECREALAPTSTPCEVQDELCSSQEPGDVHTEHCFQGEYKHCCKYGDGDDCTAKPTNEALAQPDYHAVKTYHEGKPVYVSQPEQEPVAWTVVGDGKFGEIEIGQHAEIDLDACRYWVSRGYSLVPLYTTLPKEQQSCDKRPWVGLTDEEIDSYFEDHGWSPSEDYYPVIKDIEAKLKEKNT